MKRTPAEKRWMGMGAVLAAVVAGACLWGNGVSQGQATAPTTAPVAGEPGDAPHPVQRTPDDAAQQANGPGGMMDQAANAGSQVYVDDSFASIEKLRGAIRYASQGQSELAINAYQSIIDTYGQKLVYLNNDSYVSITDYVRQKLLEMPAVRSGMYDQLLGVRAKKEIEKATAARDLPGLIRACDQYFPSAAAYAGLSQAAAWHFERAEFAAAARIWEELEKHPAVGPHKPELLFRAAVAESMQGNAHGASLLRDRLAKEFPGATGQVEGADVPLLAKLESVLAMPAWAAGGSETGAKDEWPAFQGGPSRSNLLSVNASIGAQLWTTDLRGGGDTTVRGGPIRPLRVNGRLMARQRMMPQGMATDPRLVSYPVMSGGLLLVHTGQRVLALSANAGTFAWAYPDQGTRPDAAKQVVTPDQEGMPLQPSEHDSVSVLGDRAFAVLPAVQGRQPTSDDEVEDASLTATRIVCLDRADGHEHWSTPAQAVKLPSKGILTFVGSPIATRQGIFAIARKVGDGAFVQLYLVRLEPETGKPTWSCYLCSASAGMYYGMGANFANIPIPTLADDVLYVATGQGATCAVDANVGRILWLQINEAAKKQRSANEYYNPAQIAPSWKFNPPLVHGDRLLAFESAAGEATLTLCNRWTGKPIKTLAAKDLGASSIDVVAGMIGSQVILTGGKVMALDLDKIDETTTLVWTCDFPASTEAGKPEGRPFLTSSGLYVPFEKGMMLVDLHTGKQGDFWQWPKTQRDQTGKPGNFLVTSEQVVVVSDTDVAGYSRWETARDNRLAQIQARPQDPTAYLALAEIAFRTSHLDLAQENMKRSVELATGASAGSGEAASGKTDVLAKLYKTCLNFAEQLLDRTPNEARDGARFYYEQCRATARTPEQQAEWRLSMSDLSLAQNKPEEAATLYNEVLADPALRAAPFHRGDGLARAGVTSELKFKLLVEKQGPSVYRRFEDQAAALEATGQSQRDPVQLQQVMDAYPNSAASLTAATQLAAVEREKQDWLGALKALRWLYPRTTESARGQVTADLAAAHVALKRFTGAMAWTERGLRQYKDFSWTDAASHESMTFVKLRDHLQQDAGVAEGRRPILPPPQMDSSGRPLLGPAMDESSASAVLTTGTLLVPLEQSPSLRRPDKLFVYRLRSVLMYDPANPASAPGRVELPQTGQAALIGSVGDISVVVQSRTAIGIDTRKNVIAWTIPIAGTGSVAERAPGNNGGRRFIRQLNGGQIIIQGGGQLIINGNVVNGQDGDVNVDATASMADPEVIRQMAFARLGRSSFSTMRILNNKLVVVTNGAIVAYDITTGKPAWQDATGNALAVKLPPGVPTVLSGNEDAIVAEVDSTDRNSTTFFVVDAESGKFRKQINLEEEHAQWRSVGEDGTLYCVTDQSVEAFDLFSDQDKPLWRRSDLQSKFPSATVLTLDGLMLVNANLELMCLSQDGGEVRWPTAAQGPVRLDDAEPQFLRATVDGDQVIYETDHRVLAYHTLPQDDEQKAWRGSVDRFPPFDSMELSDPYVVAMATGPVNGNAQHNVKVVLYNRKGGKLHASGDIKTAAGVGEGPVMTAWELVDNGIVLQIGSSVHFYHGKAK